MNGDYEQFKEAKSAALMLGKNYQESELLAREALGLAFNSKSAATHFLPENPALFQEKWAPILTDYPRNTGLTHRTLIRIPKEQYGVKEISYDVTGDFITFDIKASQKITDKEKIILEHKPAVIDSAFFFGANGNGEFADIVAKEKITHLDYEKLNGKTITEATFEIIQSIKNQPLVTTSIPTILMASLLMETDNLRKKTSPGIFALAGNLLEFGADKKKIREIIEKSQPQSFPQLLGRALARTQINDALKSVWTFIAPTDLEKTGNQNANSQIIHQVVCSVKNYMPDYSVFIALWQIQNEVFGIIHADTNREIFYQGMQESLQGEIHRDFFLAGPYKNFSEAEIKIQEALKKIT